MVTRVADLTAEIRHSNQRHLAVQFNITVNFVAGSTPVVDDPTISISVAWLPSTPDSVHQITFNYDMFTHRSESAHDL